MLRRSQAPAQVILPQEGASLVACASSRFELETFSGSVVESRSTVLEGGANPLLRLLSRAPACLAVHELLVRAPDGAARSFRVGTALPDVPAQVRAAPAHAARAPAVSLETPVSPTPRPVCACTAAVAPPAAAQRCGRSRAPRRRWASA